MLLSAANAVPLDGLVSEAMVQEAARTCAHLLPYVVDRADLHGRDPLEKFHNLLMGEIAELAVIAYLTGQGKVAASAVDKQATRPDAGHDVVVRRKDGTDAKCSVKSSLSYHHGIAAIPEMFRPAFNHREPRDINIQVYYHYNLRAEPRTTVAALTHAYIIGWAPEKRLLAPDFTVYPGERRRVADLKLADLSPMAGLLPLLS
ncbi:hypothetical protein QR90_15925 [Deinococcus radiopugnans]|uniref:Uncharacterized protein n=1 Tax=Deinococcus radiopugnans TaxID=57497 RepID=A0A0A7KJA0_9DEIO|nr:hypothetical protein [Deinococcus radiopugnans]AIZ46221.1 hypothetical protein QR90_15925 [Deinococcus radiopugnans]